jgi:hypothetical protein
MDQGAARYGPPYGYNDLARLETMAKKIPKATKIIVIRHAEKPAKDGAPYGVTEKGKRSSESLEVRGWQRAGALMSSLAPTHGEVQHHLLATPQFLYASKPLRRRGSRRPIETITPLAAKLHTKINTTFARSEYASMIDNVISHKGVVLICWQREYIPQIAAEILGKKNSAPASWPEDCFDMIWVFDLDRKTSRYKFRQVPQQLLTGDRTRPIR